MDYLIRCLVKSSQKPPIRRLTTLLDTLCHFVKDLFIPFFGFLFDTLSPSLVSFGFVLLAWIFKGRLSDCVFLTYIGSVRYHEPISSNFLAKYASDGRGWGRLGWRMGRNGGYDGTVTINLGHISALCQVQVESSISTSIAGLHDHTEWAHGRYPSPLRAAILSQITRRGSPEVIFLCRWSAGRGSVVDLILKIFSFCSLFCVLAFFSSISIMLGGVDGATTTHTHTF